MLQVQIFWRLFKLFELESLYYELILPTALYQMIVAQKIK